MMTLDAAASNKERILLWSAIGLGMVCLRTIVVLRKTRRERDDERRRCIQQQRRYQHNDGRHVSFQTEHKEYAVPAPLEHGPYAKELRVAIELALAAGNNMVAYCESKGTSSEEHYRLSVTAKGQPEDFCTQVDVENEFLIANGLLKRFPNHVVIGEESTGTGTIPRLTNQPTWIIDPIDGTTNFAAGLPLSCVSIGFCVKGIPVLGVVYAPLTHELYTAVLACGAYRNGHAIIRAKHQRTLNESIVCAEFGYARGKDEVLKMTGALQSILLHGCRSIRMLGSGVLDLCYVATGRLDVVYAGVASEGWKPWDYCAGLVVATEAGCHVEAIDQAYGEPFDLYSKSIICASSKALVVETRQILRQEISL